MMACPPVSPAAAGAVVAAAGAAVAAAAGAVVAATGAVVAGAVVDPAVTAAAVGPPPAEEEGAAGPQASARKPMRTTPPVVSRNCRRVQLPARGRRAAISIKPLCRGMDPRHTSLYRPIARCHRGRSF